MAFTTWATEKTRVLDQISAINMTLSSIGIKDRAKAYRDIDQLKEWLKYIDKQILIEAGTGSKIRVADVSGV